MCVCSGDFTIFISPRVRDHLIPLSYLVISQHYLNPNVLKKKNNTLSRFRNIIAIWWCNKTRAKWHVFFSSVCPGIEQTHSDLGLSSACPNNFLWFAPILPWPYQSFSPYEIICICILNFYVHIRNCHLVILLVCTLKYNLHFLL